MATTVYVVECGVALVSIYIALLEEVCHWSWALEFYSLSPFLVFSASNVGINVISPLLAFMTSHLDLFFWTYKPK